MPMSAATAVTPRLTTTEVRAPWITPDSTSRPRSSEPIGCAREGGDSGGATDANGSPGARRSAKSARPSSAIVRATPSTAAGVLSASLIANAWIEPHVREVGDDVGGDDGERDEHEQREQHGRVARLDGGEHQLALARPGEHRLHERRARAQHADAAAD